MSGEDPHKILKDRKNFIATPASSATRYLNYADEGGFVEVQFPDGDVYHYLNVPPRVWQTYRKKIESGESSGKFLNSVIKKFPFIQVK